MSKKQIALAFIVAALSLAAVAGAQKVQRTIKTTYVGTTQAIITCSTGRIPVSKEAAGSLIVSCEQQK